ncbi:hypothetical protein Lser_V15G01301 [Lactuca serriola]
MAAFSFATNCHWPTFQQLHQDTAVFPPSPELLSFHDNFTFSDTCINNPFSSLESNHHFSSFNNGVTTTKLSFHSPVRYPTLSSSYLPPITTQQHRLPKPLPDLTQLSSFTHGQYSPYPQNPNVWPMEQLQPELPPLPEIYHYGGSAVDPVMDTFQVKESNGVHVTTGNRNVGGRLSAQSMAARIRRRRISEKTLELGKLVPGGHRMNTAEMFQAAFKYVKFLQAQVGVLQHIGSSQEQSEELHALVTSRSVQEKLYHAEKCIVTRTLGESLAVDHQGINDK